MVLLVSCMTGLEAQELEPRRWSHLPIGANFAGFGYAYSDYDIAFEPAVEIESARADVHTLVASYVRVLEVFGREGRVDFLLPYSTGRWEGLLEGEPASTRRNGFNDPRVRFAVNLFGSEPQRGADFRVEPVNTIVGAALEVIAPLGEYNEDRLINLGANQWVIRPQIGFVHTRNRWAAELTGSVWFYTDNDEFFDDNTRERDPLLSIQGHLVYTFRPGLWASLSAAWGEGGQSTISGQSSGDKIEKALWAISVGLPVTRRQGIKLAYVGGGTEATTGDDFSRLLMAYSVMWGGN